MRVQLTRAAKQPSFLLLLPAALPWHHHLRKDEDVRQSQKALAAPGCRHGIMHADEEPPDCQHTSSPLVLSPVPCGPGLSVTVTTTTYQSRRASERKKRTQERSSATPYAFCVAVHAANSICGHVSRVTGPSIPRPLRRQPGPFAAR